MTDIHNISNVIFPSDDCNKVRGHIVLSSLNHSRSSLLSLNISAEEYMVRMQRESDRMDQNNPFCYSARMWTDFRVRVSGQD